MRSLLLLVLLVPIAVRAESVTVKGAGDVNLASFDCTQILRSKLLHRVCYNEAHQYLVAQIGADHYDSCNISPKTVDGLIEANHVVAYYNQHIRAGHKCTDDLRQRSGIAPLNSGSAQAEE